MRFLNQNNNFLPLLAGLLLCPVVATNSCKQSKSSFGFWVVQLWPTFNGLNFESVLTNPVLAWFIPVDVGSILRSPLNRWYTAVLSDVFWCSSFPDLLGTFLAQSIFGFGCFRQKCRKCNICYLLGMSFPACGEKSTADFSAIETFLK